MHTNEFNEIMKKLEKLEELMFSNENTTYSRIWNGLDEFYENCALAYYYLNDSNDLHHWCNGIADYIRLAAKARASAKKPPVKRDKLLSMFLDTLNTDIFSTSVRVAKSHMKSYYSMRNKSFNDYKKFTELVIKRLCLDSNLMDLNYMTDVLEVMYLNS